MNKFYLTLAIFILFVACSKSNAVTIDEQEIEQTIEQDILEQETAEQDEETEQNQETETEENEQLEAVVDSALQVVSGSVYFACDYGPYQFSIDSLLLHCAQEGSIMDSLGLGSLTLQDSSFVYCTYDYQFSELSDTSNYDFKITRDSLTGQIFELDWTGEQAIIATMDTIEIEGTEYVGLQYPFYNGHIICLESGPTLELFFFNVYIGGCFHDLMIYEWY